MTNTRQCPEIQNQAPWFPRTYPLAVPLTVRGLLSQNHWEAGAVLRDPQVPGRPADPQPDGLPAGPAPAVAGQRGPHHPAAQLLHQAEGQLQAGGVHQGDRRNMEPTRERIDTMEDGGGGGGRGYSSLPCMQKLASSIPLLLLVSMCPRARHLASARDF